MAHLNSKTTDGRLSFVKYVKENPKWNSEMEFSVEMGVTEMPIVKIEKNVPVETGVIVKQGEKIKILSREYKTLGKQRFALVKLISGSRVQGYLSLRAIRKPTSANVMQAEEMAIRDLESSIRKAKVPIDIVVKKTGDPGEFKVKEITNAAKVGGTPKADVALVNRYGTPVLWISHKKAGGASAFQQYSGVSKQAGASIHNHPEVQSFLKSVVDYIEGDHVDEKEINEAINLAQEIIYNSDNMEWPRIIKLPRDSKETLAELAELDDIELTKDMKQKEIKETIKEAKKKYPSMDEKEKRAYDKLIRDLGKPLDLKSITDDRRILQDEFMSRGWQKASNQIRNMFTMQYRDFIKNPELDKGDISAATGRLSIPVWREIKDPLLKRMAVYGPGVMANEYKYDANNVQLIGQGNPILRPTDSDATFSLSFSSHMTTNEDVDNLHEDYVPVLSATYRSGRGFVVGGKSYQGARVGISPSAMIKNRSSARQI